MRNKLYLFFCVTGHVYVCCLKFLVLSELKQKLSLNIPMVKLVLLIYKKKGGGGA